MIELFGKPTDELKLLTDSGRSIDLTDWMKGQISIPTYAGGGRFAISDQISDRLIAVAAIKDAVDRGLLPNIFLDRALETQPEPPETFERIYGGIWNIPQEE